MEYNSLYMRIECGSCEYWGAFISSLYLTGCHIWILDYDNIDENLKSVYGLLFFLF